MSLLLSLLVCVCIFGLTAGFRMGGLPLRKSAARLQLSNKFGDEFGREVKPPATSSTPVPTEAGAEVDAEALAVAEEKKRELSDFMKNKMRREADSLGGNPDKASANPILIVSAIVGVLAILSFATGAISP